VKLGGHLSAKDGLRFVTVNARALGFTCIQTMLGDPDGLQPFVIEDQTADEYKRRMRGIDTFVHLPYILNPCEEIPRKRNFYRAVVRRYLRTANMLGAKGVVLHPGFKKELTEKTALKNVVGFLESVVEDDLPTVLVETDAGSKNGSAVGSIGFCHEVVRKMGTDKVRMCLDTEHVWARGVNLWDERIRKIVLEEEEDIIGLVHLNCPDKEVLLWSYIDRHNSPFASFKLNSDSMVRDLVARFPCVLERRSLSVQKQDLEYILRLV